MDNENKFIIRNIEFKSDLSIIKEALEKEFNNIEVCFSFPYDGVKLIVRLDDKEGLWFSYIINHNVLENGILTLTINKLKKLIQHDLDTYFKEKTK